jgi:tetratricopeptide (TPR) repeat protein/pimeloyl-ACP methyl ester carboxylesterase
MYPIKQEEFQVPNPKALPENEPLVVHVRPSNTETNLVVFVHGLGGTRYGTWGNFPKFLFEDFKDQVAIGLYEYVTAFGRWRITASISLESEATIFAHIIRDLPAQYQRVVIIGHSMGGLLAKAAVKSLIDENARSGLTRTAGLILMGTPQAGSQRVLPFLDWFSYDAQALKPHGEFVTKITRTFADHVTAKQAEADADKVFIPVFAVFSPADLAVDQFSAALTVGRRKEVRGTHTSFVKPKYRDDVLTFVEDAVKECITSRDRPIASRRSSSPGQPVSQLSGVPTNLPLQAPLDPQIAAQLSSIGIQTPLVFLPSPAVIAQAAQPKPRLDELFEIITDPAEVPRALFQTEASPGLAPDDAEYIGARQGVPDVQGALQTALREARGRLLVVGRRGIGKTREIAQLAREAAATRWKVLVARSDSDARLGEPISMPPDLLDAKLLIVIDNLHARIPASTDKLAAPYLQRLEQLLQWLERRVTGKVRVIATGHDEPRYQPYFELPPDGQQWHGVGLFRLPDISDESLQGMLKGLAVRANVTVATDDVPKFIENSDRKPETVFINVDRARHTRVPLTATQWLPTEGESWALRFVSVRADNPGADRVYQVLQLFTDAGLPARVSYVTAIAAETGERDPAGILQVLVGDSLLRLRQGILTPFSAEQLKELVGPAAAGLSLKAYASKIEAAILNPDTRPSAWEDDLFALVAALDRGGDPLAAEQLASRTIGQGMGGARAYRVRAGIRFALKNLTGVEADLTKALETGGEQADTSFLRATVRMLLGNPEGALADLDAAQRAGKDDHTLRTIRAIVEYQLQHWETADRLWGEMIERGEASGGIFFMRGTARLQLKNAEGADADLTAALEAGVDLDEITTGLRALQVDTPASSSATPAPGPGTELVYALRGFARFVIGNSAGAEEDLTRALAGGFGGRFRSFTDTLTGSSLPLLQRVREQLGDSAAVGFGDSHLLHLRGLARCRQNKFAEAKADFDQALAGGFSDGEVYLGRAWAEFGIGQAAEAERDATIALDRGKAEVFTFVVRGFALIALSRFAEAEQDFIKGLELDATDDKLLTGRGLARCSQGNLQGADEDLSAAIQRNPEGRTLFQRGCLRFDLDRLVDAELDFTTAIERGYHAPEVFTMRGFTRIGLDKVTDADADASAAFTAGPPSPVSHSLRGFVRLRQQRYADADADFSAAIDLGRRDAWVFANRAEARFALNQFADAESDYDAVLLLVTDAATFVNRGRTRLQRGKPAEALADFRAAIKAGLDDAQVHVQAARALKEQKRYVEAEAEIDLAVARENQPATRDLRAYYRLFRGDMSGAEADFSDSLTRQPTDAEALRLRGLVRYAQGKNADALADFNAVEKVSSNSIEFLGWRVLVNARLGDLEQAIKDCDALDAIDRDGSEARGSRGAIQFARDDFDGALDLFTTAAVGDSSWYFWRGMALLFAGRVPDARQAYEQALAANEPVDMVLALSELDFYLGRSASRAATEAAPILALIRTELTRRLQAPGSAAGERDSGAARIHTDLGMRA